MVTFSPSIRESGGSWTILSEGLRPLTIWTVAPSSSPIHDGDEVRNRSVAVLGDGCDLHPLAPEDQRGSRHDVSLLGRRGLEMNLRQRAGHELACAVVHIDLDKQRAAYGIDGVGSADQGALEGSSQDTREK